jgi:hypothetical protein
VEGIKKIKNKKKGLKWPLYLPGSLSYVLSLEEGKKDVTLVHPFVRKIQQGYQTSQKGRPLPSSLLLPSSEFS